jgi:hypothetical protein
MGLAKPKVFEVLLGDVSYNWYAGRAHFLLQTIALYGCSFTTVYSCTLRLGCLLHKSADTRSILLCMRLLSAPGRVVLMPSANVSFVYLASRWDWCRWSLSWAPTSYPTSWLLHGIVVFWKLFYWATGADWRFGCSIAAESVVSARRSSSTLWTGTSTVVERVVSYLATMRLPWIDYVIAYAIWPYRVYRKPKSQDICWFVSAMVCKFIFILCVCFFFLILFCMLNAVILHVMVVSYVISILFPIINICHILDIVWLAFLHCYFCSLQFIKIYIVREYRKVLVIFVYKSVFAHWPVFRPQYCCF